MYKTGETVTVDFCTQTPGTGAATNADSTPTATLVLNGTDNAASVTVTNKATGVYKASVVLPAVTDGDTLRLRVTAVVGGVTGKAVVWGGEGTAKRVAELHDLAAGAPMDLVNAPNATALLAIANKVETEIIDDTDSEKVLTAITDKIASVNPSLAGLTLAAIASAVWANGTRVLTAGTNIVLAKGTGVTGFNDLSAGQVNAEVDTALADYDAPTKAEMDSAFTALSTHGDSTWGAGSVPSAAAIADAVWDELLSGHATVGSTGAALTAAGSSGDPWSTLLPGGYAAGTAGYLVGVSIPAIKEVTDAVAPGEVAVVSPVTTAGDVRITAGDSYAAAQGRRLRFADDGSWPDLTGAAVTLNVSDGTMVAAGTVAGAGTAAQVVDFHPTAAQTALLAPAAGSPSVTRNFDLRAAWAGTPGDYATVHRGKCYVTNSEAS
jgi:hypothetical protein